MLDAIARVGEVELGPVDLVPPGEGRAFCLGGSSIAVFRQRDGAIYAVQNECPHQGGPLAEGMAGGGSVICPLHSRKFDLRTGACAQDPAHTLRTYPVRVEDGRLIVSVP
jgi:nitrite reductase (NADH) small subunit